jgi:probable phosphoglycerate mutase
VNALEASTVRLHVIRHGETDWSRTGQHTGHTDLALTPHGEIQARELVPWLSHIHFDHVFTSPLQRARHTCALAGLGDAAVIEPDLMEWNYGDYEGVRSADIRKTRPGWSAFRDGFPGGESPAQIGARADALIARLSKLSGNVALFSHGEFSAALAARWIGLEVAEGQHFYLDTASLSVLAFNAGHPDVRVIALWNAVPGALGGSVLF